MGGLRWLFLGCWVLAACGRTQQQAELAQSGGLQDPGAGGLQVSTSPGQTATSDSDAGVRHTSTTDTAAWEASEPLATSDPQASRGNAEQPQTSDAPPLSEGPIVGEEATEPSAANLASDNDAAVPTEAADAGSDASVEASDAQAQSMPEEAVLHCISNADCQGVGRCLTVLGYCSNTCSDDTECASDSSAYHRSCVYVPRFSNGSGRPAAGSNHCVLNCTDSAGCPADMDCQSFGDLGAYCTGFSSTYFP